MVTKLDRLARSFPDARAIADELTAREVTLALGTSVHDPTDPVGRLLFNVLAMVAEFEAGLIRAHTRRHEGGQSQGAPARQAAQAQPDAGGAPGRAVPRRRAHRQRTRRALRRHPAPTPLTRPPIPAIRISTRRQSARATQNSQTGSSASAAAPARRSSPRPCAIASATSGQVAEPRRAVCNLRPHA